MLPGDTVYFLETKQPGNIPWCIWVCIVRSALSTHNKPTQYVLQARGPYVDLFWDEPEVASYPVPRTFYPDSPDNIFNTWEDAFDRALDLCLKYVKHITQTKQRLTGVS